MSKLFFDHLISLDDLWVEIEILEISHEEKQTVKETVDHLLQQRILTVVLDILPQVHHEEFLELYYETPYEPRLLKYLKKHAAVDVYTVIIKTGEEVKHEVRKKIKKHHPKR